MADQISYELSERKESDLKKDTNLISNGWKVYRIKWKKLTKEFREDLKETISKIFNQSGV